MLDGLTNASMRPVIVVAGDAERITAALEATFVTLSPFHNPHIDRRVAKLLGVAKVTILCRAKRERFHRSVSARWFALMLK